MPASLVLCLLLLQQGGTFDAVFREGLLALQKGDASVAADRLSVAVALNKESGLAWTALAQARSKLGQLDEADKAALQAEVAGGKESNVLRALLIYWTGRGIQQSVVRVAQRSLQLQDTPELHTTLGKALLASDRFDEAVVEFRKVALASPIREESVFSLSQLLLSREKFEEAAQVLEAGMEELSQSAQLELALGVARYGQRRFSDAIAAFLKTIELQPGVEQPYAFLGKILDQAGDRLPEIERRVREYLQQDPQSGTVNLVYAKVLLSQPGFDAKKVEDHLHNAIGDGRPSWEPYFELGVLHVRLKRYEDAAGELMRAVELKPNEPAPHYHLARVYDRLGKTAQAAGERAIHRQLTAQPLR